jgi:hypothetical protein
MALHPLHQKSIVCVVVFGLTYLGLGSLVYQPRDIETLSVHCIDRYQAEQSEKSRVQSTALGTIDLHSWDVFKVNPNELSEAIRYLKKISATVDRPYMITLQGVQPWMKSSLKSLLLDEGGCWAYAPLWETPKWVSVLQNNQINVYKAIFGAEAAREAIDHGLWTAVIGDPTHLKVQAQRWSLPPRPGRWPWRRLYEKPAALAMSVEAHIGQSNSDQFQVVNLSLSDTHLKHQSGALAIQKLTRPPLSLKFQKPWAIVGDWRVNPPQTPPHPQVGYRFQRFSLQDIESTLSVLFTTDTDPQKWGRWRLNEYSEPSVIDHAYASQGQLTPYTRLTKWLPWIGPNEQRAPLFVKWTVGNK